MDFDWVVLRIVDLYHVGEPSLDDCVVVDCETYFVRVSYLDYLVGCKDSVKDIKAA